MIFAILFWALVIAAVAYGLMLVFEGSISLPKRKAKAVEAPSKPVELSFPSQDILRWYNKLPEAHRPMDNIEEILRALDVKHDVKKVNAHFVDQYGSCYRIEYTWSCCDRRRTPHCLFADYHALKDEISWISQALAKQEHALAIAAVQDRLLDLDVLTSRLREERALINDVTKELS